jgi:hypothetical protein
MEWGEVETRGWVSDLLRGNIFSSFSMGNISILTNVISVDSPMHADYEYMSFNTHVCQELSGPKVRKRSLKFGQL